MTTLEELAAMDKKDALAVSAKEGRALHELVKGIAPKTILEVGTGHGYSTLWMSLAMGNDAVLYTLDDVARPHLFDLPQFKNGKKIVFIKGRLDERYDSIPEHIDFAFLDSTHIITDVAYDIEAVSPSLESGGVIAVHDTIYRVDMGTALKDYFSGVETEGLKAVDVKPSSVKWMYANMDTEFGLGIAVKMGKGNDRWN